MDPYVEVHSPLSALIVEEELASGFWLSSYTLSMLNCVLDENQIGREVACNLIRSIRRFSTSKIMVDLDNGFGVPSIARLSTNEIFLSGADSVVIEDKSFPKQNSFLANQPSLIPVDRFSEILCLTADLLQKPTFMGKEIIARTEALVVGSGPREAAQRCIDYIGAGASGLLIHTKDPSGHDLIDALSLLPRRIREGYPIVVAPTAIEKFAFADYEPYGVDRVVIANAMLHASVRAFRAECSSLQDSLHDQELNLSDAVSVMRSLIRSVAAC